MPLPRSQGCAAQSLDCVALDTLVRLFPPESPPHDGETAPVKESPPDSTMYDVFSSTLNSSVTLPVTPTKAAPAPALAHLHTLIGAIAAVLTIWTVHGGSFGTCAHACQPRKLDLRYSIGPI